MVRIKNMEMPENCEECRFQTDSGYCKAMSDNFCGNTNDKERPEWCPLEQESVIPILKREGRNINYNDYECPICGEELNYLQKYCSECGRSVNWICNLK